MNWRARLDAITDDHITAVRDTEAQLDEIDSLAREAMERVVEQVGAAESASIIPETQLESPPDEAPPPQTPVPAAVGDRSLPHARRRSVSPPDDYVLPSDWTEEDEARMEGYGPPKSWLA
ncbi:hypothetical protein [Nocardia vermiculata]|uniref:Uncharacterized protein n=1 Tax=Nocardia vermiculata TaxID=257274 RepID=A0A846XXV3_9NOCA|nr:hypothetical protein [Nocardia vermiculata]NKY50524.1 hypothetical protein [Nocardia vermiculata]